VAKPDGQAEAPDVPAIEAPAITASAKLRPRKLGGRQSLRKPLCLRPFRPPSFRCDISPSDMSLLPYSVVACTSEDKTHPVGELQDFHAQSRGWQCVHWPDFPQAVVLQFSESVSLHQVQVLSHQYKIASFIEMYIGDRATDTGSVKYLRIGHFTLDSNERSNWQARELKTVYVPRATEGRFLKLLLHKCHVNEHNLYNQVGLLAVRAIGTGSHQTSVPPADPLLEARPLEAVPDVGRADVGPSSPDGWRPMRQQLPAPHSQRNAVMDPACLSMIAGLDQQKQEAVAVEDFDEAHRLKTRIEEFKAVGVELCELERQKDHFVAAEDYDKAKEIKQELAAKRDAYGLPPTLTPFERRALVGAGPVNAGRDLMAEQAAEAQRRIEYMAQQAVNGSGDPSLLNRSPPPVDELQPAVFPDGTYRYRADELVQQEESVGSTQMALEEESARRRIEQMAVTQQSGLSRLPDSQSVPESGLMGQLSAMMEGEGA